MQRAPGTRRSPRNFPNCSSRIHDEFLSRFEEKRLNAAPPASDQTIDIFDQLIDIGQRTLETMLSEYKQAHTITETSQAFSPRQKIMLLQWLDHGNVSPRQMNAMLELADWARQEFSTRPCLALSGDHAVNAIAGMLTSSPKRFSMRQSSP